MIPYQKIKEILTLIKAGTDIGTVSKIFNISEKKIKHLYNKTKGFSKYGVMDEEETAPTGSGEGTSVASQPEHSTWDSGVARGHANPIDSKHKWESGINRGKANPLN